MPRQIFPGQGADQGQVRADGDAAGQIRKFDGVAASLVLAQEGDEARHVKPRPLLPVRRIPRR